MKYKYGVLMAALAASLFGAPAFAGSNAASLSNSDSLSNATGVGLGGQGGQGGAAFSGSNSRSGSVSNSTGTGGNAQGSGTSSSAITFNDPSQPSSTTARIVTTGTAIAPSVYNNNVCALGASAAGGFLGGAFAFGFDRVDHNCDIRANAALLGHFVEVNAATATHAVDPAIREQAERAAVAYAQWANNYMCMANEELARSAPPGANFCATVATQQGMQVVPQAVPTAYAAPPPIAPAAAVYVPPPRPMAQPQAVAYHAPGPHDAMPSSYRTGPISGYSGPDSADD